MKKKVFTSSNEEIEYDYLIIATGGNLPNFPLTDEKETTLEKLKSNAQLIKSANRIAVIGGGASGVEFSGEIASYYPTKKVTLIHATSKLIDERLSPKFQNNLQGNLKSANIDLILEDRIDSFPDTTVPGPYTLRTKKGKEIEVDAYFFFGPYKLNTNWLTKSHASVLNEKKSNSSEFKITS